jgi:hypothetical protein
MKNARSAIAVATGNPFESTNLRNGSATGSGLILDLPSAGE